MHFLQIERINGLEIRKIDFVVVELAVDLQITEFGDNHFLIGIFGLRKQHGNGRPEIFGINFSGWILSIKTGNKHYTCKQEWKSFHEYKFWVVGLRQEG